MWHLLKLQGEVGELTQAHPVPERQTRAKGTTPEQPDAAFRAEVAPSGQPGGWGTADRRPFWGYSDPYVIDNSGLQVEMLEFDYSTPDVSRVPSLVASTTFNNGTDAQASQNFADTKTTTASFKWGITEGLKLGAKTSFKVGTPIIAEGKIEASVELSFSATQEQTKTESQAWQYGATIPVPPHSVVVASAVVSMAEYNPTWFARLRITGQSVAWHQDNPSSGMSTYPNILCKGLTGFTVDDSDNSAVYVASGTFDGAQGLSVEVTTKQSPYPPTDAAAAIREVERAGV